MNKSSDSGEVSMETMTAKERVLKSEPTAKALGPSPCLDNEDDTGWIIVARNGYKLSDWQPTKAKAWEDAASKLPTPIPTPSPARFQNVYCSQCGEEFGPGNEGYSHCEDHEESLSDRENYLIEEGLRACREGDSMRCGKSETKGWVCKRKLAHSGPCAPELIPTPSTKENRDIEFKQFPNWTKLETN